MYRCYRGWIPAIACMLCAASWANASLSKNAADRQDDGWTANSTNFAFNLADPIQAALQSANDSSWIVRDDRVLMSDHAAKIEAIALPHLVSLNEVKVQARPKLDPPDIVAVQSTSVNELMVPLPTLGVVSTIALFAVFYHVGSRMLRISTSR